MEKVKSLLLKDLISKTVLKCTVSFIIGLFLVSMSIVGSDLGFTIMFLIMFMYLFNFKNNTKELLNCSIINVVAGGRNISVCRRFPRITYSYGTDDRSGKCSAYGVLKTGELCYLLCRGSKDYIIVPQRKVL